MFFVLSLSFALLARAEVAAPAEVHQLAERFQRTMMECPQRIWSQYNWAGLKLVLVYPSQQQSWVWDASANRIESISNDELPASAKASAYEFFDLHGQKAMSLGLESGFKGIFELGVHEVFHYVGQQAWNQSQADGRGTPYPLHGEPRFYRRMIFDHLKEFLLTGSSVSLGRAKYWFEKWSTEFPEEVSASTDSLEGTAKYVETLAAVVAELGCSATEAEIKSKVLSEIPSRFGDAVSGKELALDAEGYDLGGLAALAMRFNGSDLATWNGRMARGETPLQVLLETVSPLAEPAPQALRDFFMAAARTANDEMKPILDDDIANWRSTAYVRVSAPSEWLQSNLLPRFFVHSAELGMELFALAADHQFLSPSIRGSSYRIKTDAVVFDHYSPACPDQYSFTLVPRTALKFGGREVSLYTDTVEGRLVGEIKTDEFGFDYFCVE